MEPKSQPPEQQVIIGKRVKHIRLLLGWKQNQLAQLLGIHRSGISRIERGEQPLTLDQADILTRQIGMSIDVLVGRTAPTLELLELHVLAGDLPRDLIDLLLQQARALAAFWVRFRQRLRGT